MVGESFVDEKPELFHTFRPEQDLGNLPLAFVFSALTLSPIFVLGKLVIMKLISGQF